jgi:primosomal protein N'
MREDFEIFPIRGYDGKIRYAFNVEYYGFYVCNSMEEAEKKVMRVRQQVKQRLEEIERQNQEYYKRLAKKQEQMLRVLKEAKNTKEDSRHIHAREIQRRKQTIRALIQKGYSNEAIMLKHPDYPLRSISHIRSALERSNSL